MTEKDVASTPKTTKHKEPGALSTALAVGAATGACACFVAAVIATLRNRPRKGIFIVGTTLNCSIIGAGYYVTRDTLSKHLFALDQNTTVAPSDKVLLSGAAAATVGGIWGTIVGGRRHGVPGFIVFGLAGLGGQVVWNRMMENKDAQASGSGPVVEKKGNVISRLLASPNSPIRKLSHEEYIEKMRERQLVLDAEIALIDEEIERLRQSPDKGDRQDQPRK